MNGQCPLKLNFLTCSLISLLPLLLIVLSNIPLSRLWPSQVSNFWPLHSPPSLTRGPYLYPSHFGSPITKSNSRSIIPTWSQPLPVVLPFLSTALITKASLGFLIFSLTTRGCRGMGSSNTYSVRWALNPPKNQPH